MVFASLARAHERVRVQNLRDFPQTKLDSNIYAPFLLNEHGDPRVFCLVFATNSLIKNIFQEGKSLIEYDLFLHSSILGVFWPRRGLQANHGTVRKSAIFPQKGNQKPIKGSNTTYVNKRTFTSKIKVCVF